MKLLFEHHRDRLENTYQCILTRGHTKNSNVNLQILGPCRQAHAKDPWLYETWIADMSLEPILIYQAET